MVVIDDDNSDGEGDNALPLARPLAEMLRAARLEVRHLPADVIEALEHKHAADARGTLTCVYALLFALAEVRVSLVDDLTFVQRASVLLELLYNGPAAAGRELRSLALPGCAAVRVPDEEALAAAGRVPVYEVAIDARGAIVAGSHRVCTHDRTVAHDTLGPSNMLRVLLPEEGVGSELPQLSAALAELVDVLAGGLVVCGRRFEFLGAKTDHKLRDLKMHFVAVPTPVAPALGTREPVPRLWRSAGEARTLLAAFETLPTVEKLLKRLELLFSSTVRALDNVAFDVHHCPPGLLSVAQCAGLPPAPDGRANVYVCDDIIGALPTGAPSVDANGEPRLMSDGAGLISLDLARQIPPVVSGRLLVGDDADADGSAPLITQLRLWLSGLLAKGTLCACAGLPTGVIVLRRASMVKVGGVADSSVAAARGARGAAPPLSMERTGFSRFEVCETSERATSGRLSAALIEILAEGARRAGGQAGWEVLVAHLASLQEAEVRRVRRLLTGGGQPPAPPAGAETPTGVAPLRRVDSRRVRAAALAELSAGADVANAVGVSASSMLLSGFDPTREPRLVELLSRLEGLRLGALSGFKLPLRQAVCVFGQPDPTGSLPEGHVCVVVDGMELAHQMCAADGGSGSGGSGSGSSGRGSAPTEVLVHKSPGCHPGDVRRLRHTRTPELEALLRGVDAGRAHAIFFSTRGERATADTIAGCDHDGDKFTVISDPALVHLFAETSPWDAPLRRGRKAATVPDADPAGLQVSCRSCTCTRALPRVARVPSPPPHFSPL